VRDFALPLTLAPTPSLAHPLPPSPRPPGPARPSAVYPDGKVCISILHDAGVDVFNSQETADERWRPILGVEQVLVSVLSMLGEPNNDSPANVDAAKQLRENPKDFRKRVRRTVERSLEG
jgi:ubiquitin-conjugating enzyme E2 G1